MESTVENQWTDKENYEEDKESDQLVVEEEITEEDNAEENVENLSPPEVNKLFDSEIEVYEYYRRYGLQNGFRITIRNIRKIDKVNTYLTVVCHRYGDVHRKVIDSLNPKSIMKSSCKARICAKGEKDDKWRVTQFDNEHNHDLSATKAYRFRCNRKLTVHAKRSLSLYDEAGIPMNKSFNTLVVEHGGMSTIQRSESMNTFFDGYVNGKTSLREFVRKYDCALKDKVEKEVEADTRSLSTFIPCVTQHHMEKQFQEIYTNDKFKEFQKDIINVMYCECSLLESVGFIFQYQVEEIQYIGDSQTRRTINYNVCFVKESKKRGKKNNLEPNLIDLNVPSDEALIHISNEGLKGSRTLEKDEVILRMGKGARIAAIYVGSFSLHMPTGKTIILNNCYYVPSIVRNIVSIPMLDLDGFSFIIKNNECSILRDNVLYGRGILNNGMYICDVEHDLLQIEQTNKRKQDDENLTYLWHCRLGHISENRLRTLHKEGLLDPFDFESYPTCESCLLGKMTKSPFSGHGERAADLLGLVHTDLCGPMSTQAIGGFSYFITFIDDKSRFRYVYLMKHKSEAFEKFKEYKQEVEKQTKHSIITLRSDRGGEYLNGEFLDYLKENGIVSQWTPPYTP
ncbi:hypothetical protein AgCh_025801 [Apium graveolens]